MTPAPPIAAIAARLGLAHSAIEPYGHAMAKLGRDALAALPERPGAKLVLVTAISPTPAGEGKTTTTIGLGDALQRLGRRAVVCLRQPSLGPVFGMKGGATGGGRAQLVPMDAINLHFTGDFHAIAAAHNLLAAMLDNHLHHGNARGIDVRRVSWPRVVDMNDRALRHVTVGLGGAADGVPREDGFDIVAASEVMAVFCLASSLDDLKQRLGDIVVAETHARHPVTARDLGADGAMTALLRTAFQPNLVATLEGTPALVHGGPFGNIAHGCNSVAATRAALKLGDIVVTEAGFGADLGAEKFIHIKCRASGLRPQLAVLVATVRALKMHGGAAAQALEREDIAALERGLPNLERHLDNLRRHFGLRCVVAINRFPGDTADEIAWLRVQVAERTGVPVAMSNHFAEGGAGAIELAQAVVQALDAAPAQDGLRFAYDDGDTLWDKARAVATKVYGAADIAADAKLRNRLDELQAQGCGGWPVCIAKTQYSFSTDPARRGAPIGHVLDIREVRLAAGARFVVLVCGDVMTMPGLPKVPAAERIDVDDAGRIVGLS